MQKLIQNTLQNYLLKVQLCVCVSSIISYDHGQQTAQLYIHSCIFIHGMYRDSFKFIILQLQKF
jgi:hypothetical protein